VFPGIFSDFLGTLVSFALSGVGQVDATQEHGKLGGIQLDGGASGDAVGDLKRAGLESLVPDDQTVGVPMKHLDAITPAVEEKEEMAGKEVLLGKGLADESGEAVEAFSEVHGIGVEENAHGMREAQHEGSSQVADERATVSTT
jgi:hypothetical protein